MKTPTLAFICVAVLLIAFIAPVYSSASVESKIGDNIYIVYNLGNIDPTIYNETITNQQLFNSSTIPLLMVKNLEKQHLTQVDYLPQPNVYDNATRTIRASFYLGGSDIISFTVNRTTMRKTYQVKTEWRKFQVNLTSSFAIDFAQYFAEPVANWTTKNTDVGGSMQPTFYYETTDAFLGALSFYFILPRTASNIEVKVNTITYEVAPSFEDAFINSPFLILAALIIIIAIVLVCRKVK